ncbi:C-5 cytosine-specific DNA methylase family protein [Rahnella aquatilis CIP 78.65 = ATCC 33071]|uniref:DNA (cytosine-5-)-methyltransferase n=1 Tax=Rahnella aquatilis (strain ATCC 33071 / DSM 4594 / JCM 1683 / NBRC 105701 / NCIMB 13365 / CIP 78.65) TaxID=745277 RepID=H2IY59_RAHAC|nr:DNA cytosine methyltransferase [Rahnella aquatilis]AEX53136.1 site-specific DNA methylase [Rahnella aquatilis CIP 78.65 = ATCC 33071]KFD04016.1 C-5 cytosine-specific DNA methylase family protein [Rahnella aquatilis CIP 78.65 = ATCC 33071]
MKAIDLFSGFGGSSAGARMAGIEVVWAGNHWRDAVDIHALNHPGAHHVCQDLHQADWSAVPAHDLLIASPCCQGHSKARGKKSGNPQHDASRSTAWAVVSALEFHQPLKAIIENVPEFLEWSLYPAWSAAMNALGYQLAPHIVDCADLGVPQNRVRMFIVCTRSKAPLFLRLPKYEHVAASTFLDLNAGAWSMVNKPGRAVATLERITNGRKQFGDRFLISYYGSTKNGRSLDRPIGTITTRDRWAIVDGTRMRMISVDEVMAAMSFPKDYHRPKTSKMAVHMAGNAVPPQAMAQIITALNQQG